RREKISIEVWVSNAPAAGIHIGVATGEAGRTQRADVDAGADEGMACRVNGVSFERQEENAVGGFRQVSRRAAGVSRGEVIVSAETQVEVDPAAREPDFGGANRGNRIAAELVSQLAADAQSADRQGVDGVHLAIAR